MRILIVNTHYFPEMVGGTENSLKLLAEGLAKRNDVFVMTTSENANIDSIIGT